MKAKYRAFFWLLFLSSYLYSHGGIPMIFKIMPVAFVSLIPIILVEFLIYLIKGKFGIKQSFEVSAISNILSNFVGIPITWFILVFLQLVTGGGRFLNLDSVWNKFLAVTWQSPWLISFSLNDLYWMVPSAGFFMLIPFFFISWYLKYSSAKNILLEENQKEIKRLTMWVNFMSYAVIGIILLVIIYRNRLYF